LPMTAVLLLTVLALALAESIHHHRNIPAR
jgi:hypothetical protein